MKRLKDIILSASLSLIIIVMGAGIPLVQYRCQDCAKAGRRIALVDVTEVVTYACDCGCAERKGENRKCCCCGTHRQQAIESGQSAQSGQSGQSRQSDPRKADGCAKVRIERISVPTLSTAQQVAQPLPTILHPDYALCGASSTTSSSAEGSATVPDDAPPRCHPRSRLTTFCTLLL